MVDLDKFKAEVRRVLELANRKYAYKLSRDPFKDTEILFTKTGKTAAVAGEKNYKYYLNFNLQAIRKEWDDMFTNTIPHEVAHLVCYKFPHLGRDHNQGWKDVCRALGGDGAVTHSYSITHVHGSYIYKADCGTEVYLSKQKHNNVQRGSSYRLTSTGGVYNSSSLVGYESQSGEFTKMTGRPVINTLSSFDSKVQEYIKENYDSKVDAWFDLGMIVSTTKHMLHGRNTMAIKESVKRVLNGMEDW